MDFARKILGKYGWKEGEGLGKNNDGIAKPLRATLKFDNSGFGADQAAADFNNHWWERVFNDAANNVEVNKDGQSIKMNLKNAEDSVEISTKGYSLKKLKKAKAEKGSAAGGNVSASAYENFMQAATLTNKGGEIDNPDRIEAGEIEVTRVNVLTDEELFKACGGRTAHKGARHGLKLSGKLARLEQQEKELLAKMMSKKSVGVECLLKESNNVLVAEPSSSNEMDHKKKKKKRKNKDADIVSNDVTDKKNSIDSLEEISEDVSPLHVIAEDEHERTKKSKKKKKRDESSSNT
uniref:G patch domain-containing protein 4 n=1 Tax=Stomoxys calcitrans TaxID=35570 RepID=A0A1I8NT84_STOCA